MIKSTKRGFTLIELLVVIAIIGILSSVVIASMNSARKKSRDARRISDISNIKTALEMFYDANQSYPITQAEVYTDTTGLAPNYIPKVPVDPVGAAEYTYAAFQQDGSACAAAGDICVTYHLGTMLEDATNPALDGDADATTGFDGALADCAGTAGTEACYDVTP